MVVVVALNEMCVCVAPQDDRIGRQAGRQGQTSDLKRKRDLFLAKGNCGVFPISPFFGVFLWRQEKLTRKKNFLDTLSKCG